MQVSDVGDVKEAFSAISRYGSRRLPGLTGRVASFPLAERHPVGNGAHVLCQQQEPEEGPVAVPARVATGVDGID